MAAASRAYRSVVIALAYLRRNRVQAELAEAYGVSQSTVSRAISVITPLLGKVLKDYVPTADELDLEEQYIADGTLLPCWSWAGHQELYSGKHKTTGLNVQVAYTLSGNLAWISDALPGSRHDSWCLSESGVLEGFPPGSWIGDKGYIGKGMITPVRKPAQRLWDAVAMSERNAKDVVEDLFRRQQAGDATALDDLVAEDMINHAAGPQGRDGLNLILRTIAADLGPVVVEQHHLIGDGDLVAQHLTLHGTHRASTMPLLAGTSVSGRPTAWTFIHIWRVADGMVVEHWACRDDMGLLEQVRN